MCPKIKATLNSSLCGLAAIPVKIEPDSASTREALAYQRGHTAARLVYEKE